MTNKEKYLESVLDDAFDVHQWEKTEPTDYE